MLPSFCVAAGPRFAFNCREETARTEALTIYYTDGTNCTAFYLASVSRASFSCFQFGASLSASSYFAISISVAALAASPASAANRPRTKLRKCRNCPIVRIFHHRLEGEFRGFPVVQPHWRSVTRLRTPIFLPPR